MVKTSLVNVLRDLVNSLIADKGVVIDRAALLPAYEGMVPDLFILTVSMPDGKLCLDKIKCLIYGLHEYTSEEARQSIAGVRVFDSAIEFDQYLRFGYINPCEPCEEMLQTRVPKREHEMILA
jgi:hypothetical protein